MIWRALSGAGRCGPVRTQSIRVKTGLLPSTPPLRSQPAPSHLRQLELAIIMIRPTRTKSNKLPLPEATGEIEAAQLVVTITTVKPYQTLWPSRWARYARKGAAVRGGQKGMALHIAWPSCCSLVASLAFTAQCYHTVSHRRLPILVLISSYLTKGRPRSL